MTKNRTKLEQLQRELDKRSPAEPLVIHVVWRDEATGEEEPAYDIVVDGKPQRVINMTWGD